MELFHRELRDIMRKGRGQRSVAADDLVCSTLRLVMAFRSTGFRACSEFRPDLETMSFIYELGEIVAAGGDIRSRVFA